MSQGETIVINPDERSNEDIENEIWELQERLEKATRLLTSRRASQVTTLLIKDAAPPSPTPNPSAPHFLLLLSDSALPLGSFAFSSGLESYLTHTRLQLLPPSSRPPAPADAFATFLPLSIASYASTSLPFVLAAHRNPALLPTLDDALDAAVMCTVGRRASVAQGRALLGLWERAFAPALKPAPSPAAEPLRAFAALLRSTGRESGGDDPAAVSAHLAPLFGAVCAACGLDARQTAYVFLLGHVKALVSAAVRASVMGPYQAQRLLAGGRVRALVEGAVEREWETGFEEAGQSVAVMDLWVGRHEMLYSRIFNS